MEVISQQLSVDQIRMELANLPAGLEEMYTLSLNRIQNLPAPRSVIAQRVLSWVTYAFRPFTMAALQCAMAIKAGDGEFNQGRQIDPDHLQSICLGLITVDEETDLVSLFRESASA